MRPGLRGKERRSVPLVATIPFYIPPSAPIPTVALANATRGTSPNAYIAITSMDPPTAPEHLRLSLVAGNYSGWDIPVPADRPAANVSVGDAVYLIAWHDNDRNALVDAGDAFKVTFFSGVRPTPGTYMDSTSTSRTGGLWPQWRGPRDGPSCGVRPGRRHPPS